MRVFVIAATVAVSISPSLALFAQTKSTEAEGWRTSWVEFASGIAEFRKHAKEDEFPQASLTGMANGQPTPDTWAVMKRFNGAVTFEGTFKGVKTDALMKGMTAKLDFKMPTPNDNVITHIYPTAASIPKWQSLPPGTVVKFHAKVSGIAGIQIPALASVLPDGFSYIVLLEDAEPAE